MPIERPKKETPSGPAPAQDGHGAGFWPAALRKRAYPLVVGGIAIGNHRVV